MGKVSWTSLKASKWSQVNGRTLTDRWRTWLDTGIQIFRPSADAVGITESVHIDLFKPVNATNSVGITEASTRAMRFAETYLDTFGVPEAVAYKFTSVRNEYVELYDSIALKPIRVYTDNVGITDTLTAIITLVRSATDSVGITDSHRYDVSWHFTDNAGLSESVAFGRTWHATESIGITESATAAIAITEYGNDTFSITEEFSTLVYDFSINDLSIVDIARINAATYFGLTADSIKALSINDLGHMYWANKDLHLSDRQYQSIMDYFRAVSPNGKHWVTDIEET